MPLKGIGRSRAVRSALLSFATFVIIAGFWNWCRKRHWLWAWFRRRQSSPQRLASRAVVQFEIPSSLRLPTTRGLFMITVAETTALHLDLFCNLTQSSPARLIAFRRIPQQTVRQIHAKVRSQSVLQSQQKGLVFFVFHGDEMVGSLGFSRLDSMTSSGELDLVVHKQYWDDGWAQDLHLAVLDYGFHTLHLQRVLCGVDRSNRSVRTFYENLHWNLVSVGRAGSPNIYNYVLSRQKYQEETRAALAVGAANNNGVALPEESASNICPRQHMPVQ